MAFLEKNFSPVGSQSAKRDLTTPAPPIKPQITGDPLGPNLFSFITAQALEDVKVSGYFNELRNRIYRFDLFHVSSKVNEVNPDDVEFTIIDIATSSLSPSTANIVVGGADVNAVI